jgi:hypothetical protein
MKSTKSNKVRALLAAATTLATVIGVLVATPASAVSVSPAAVCANGSCTVTFDHTGDYYQWTPPVGIKTLWFDVYGAQGGRSGGLGGKISGRFTSIPASLFVYVGGQGKTGSGQTGGFGGGGTSGSGHGDEGSGGGASDLRSSTALTDRLVVAGGGGGTGGWVGGAGGAGGSTIASAGTAGQGGAGGGATQIAGGSAGIGSAANNGTAGALGTGGAGGNGSTAGGGGGGGGYFGGGGAGGDGIPSGLDGGGGGGGSSFASIAATSTISHAKGVRTGNGQVVLTYTYAPVVTAFAPASAITNANATNFALAFSQDVQGLEATDFTFAGTASGCLVSSISGANASYTVAVSNCSDGTVLLNLAADAVFGATTGPNQVATSSTLTIDRKKPVFAITPPTTPTNLSVLPFAVSVDEPVTGLSASSFSVTGSSCAIGTVTGSAASYVVNVTGCASTATATLTVKVGVGADVAGNLGPASALASSSVIIDRVSPTVSAFTKSTASRNDLLVFELTLSESVDALTNDPQTFTVSGAGCVITKVSSVANVYSIWVTDCAEGASAKVVLESGALTDVAGNTGPVVDVSSPTVKVDDQLPRVTISADARANASVSPSFTVTFSETVTGLTLDTFTHSGTATGCVFTLTELTAGVSFRVATSGCSVGTLRMGIPPSSVTDPGGNLGPTTGIESASVIIDAASGSTTTGGGMARPRVIAKVGTTTRGATTMKAVSFGVAKAFKNADVGLAAIAATSAALMLGRSLTASKKLAATRK